MEEQSQNLEQVLSKVIKVKHQQENMLLGHEGRSRRENLRIIIKNEGYNVPNGTGEPSMIDLVEKLLRDMLEIPVSVQLDIERAHRALAPRPDRDRDNNPQSIIVKFLRYKTKEDIWGKTKVFFNGEVDLF